MEDERRELRERPSCGEVGGGVRKQTSGGEGGICEGRGC